MLEGVGVVGEETRLVEEFGSPKLLEAAVEHILQVSKGVQQGEGYLSADDGGGLQAPFRRGWQPVDTAANPLDGGISTCVPAFKTYISSCNATNSCSCKVCNSSSTKKGLPSVRSWISALRAIEAS